MLYGNHIRPLIKKENWPKSFPKDYLWTLGNGVLYQHSERSGVLYGNHKYVVRSEKIEEGNLCISLIMSMLFILML